MGSREYNIIIFDLSRGATRKPQARHSDVIAIITNSTRAKPRTTRHRVCLGLSRVRLRAGDLCVRARVRVRDLQSRSCRRTLTTACNNAWVAQPLAHDVSAINPTVTSARFIICRRCRSGALSRVACAYWGSGVIFFRSSKRGACGGARPPPRPLRRHPPGRARRTETGVLACAGRLAE